MAGLIGLTSSDIEIQDALRTSRWEYQSDWERTGRPPHGESHVAKHVGQITLSHPQHGNLRASERTHEEELLVPQARRETDRDAGALGGAHDEGREEDLRRDRHNGPERF